MHYNPLAFTNHTDNILYNYVDDLLVIKSIVAGNHVCLLINTVNYVIACVPDPSQPDTLNCPIGEFTINAIETEVANQIKQISPGETHRSIFRELCYLLMEIVSLYFTDNNKLNDISVKIIQIITNFDL